MPKLRKLFTSLKSKNGSKNQAPVENAGDQDPRKKNASSGRDITSIASGPDPKPENKKSRKKIIASYKDAAVILKQQGFDLKSQNEKALCWACENGEQEAIQLLLQLGTEIRTVRSGSPLHAAAGYGDCQIVQDLLNRGAYIMARLDSNDTALHSATRRGKFGMVEFLLNEGADVHAGGNFGLSALHIAARCGLEFIVRLLLEYGADLEATDNSNRTPLHHAAINDKFDMVMQLIKLGANSEARDNKGLAPIHLAGEAGHERTFEMLQTESKKVKAQKRQKKRGERLSSQGRAAARCPCRKYQANVNSF